MDISSLTGNYLDMYKAQNSQSAAKLESASKMDYTSATDAELMDACKEFEAYMLEMMFEEMMKTIPKSEDASSYASSMMDYVKDNLVQEIASESTQQNGLGLAQMLYEQMKRNYDL